MSTINQLIGEASKIIGAIAKEKPQGATVTYCFRSIDTIMDRVGEALIKTGLVLTIESLAPPVITFREAKNSKGYDVVTTCAIVGYRYTVSAADGSKVSVDEWAQSVDFGDKAVSQANSLAYKHALCRLFSIPTHERDPDADSTETPAATKKQAAKTPPTQNKTDLPELIKHTESGDLSPVWLQACDYIKMKPQNRVEFIQKKYRVSADLVKELKEIYRVTHGYEHP